MRNKTRVALSIVMVLLIGVIGVIVYRNQGGTCSTSIPAADDMQQALKYRAAFAPAAWQEDSLDHGDSISARWWDSTGMGHLDYLRYNCGLTRANLDNYAFNISLGGYENWERTAQCEKGNLILHEFKVKYTGQDYRTRFWLESVNDTRLAAFQLTFPATRLSNMDTFAQRLYPDLPTCS
jgi:hypothetical protein